MIKRNLGSALRGRKYWFQCREMMLPALTDNIMILLFDAELFYRTFLSPLTTLVQIPICADILRVKKLSVIS